MQLEDVTKAIEEKRLVWKAADTGKFILGGSSAQFGLRSAGREMDRLKVASGSVDPLDKAPPPKVDWRETGMVSAVKDQGNCGACVAFATCAAMESALLIGEGGALTLSEAHLFFCGAGNHACEDGWDFLPAIDRAKDVGVCSAEKLPYSDSGVCEEVPPEAKITDYSVSHSARDRRKALEASPVIAGMEVYRDFLFYKSGVYEHAVGEKVGLHAVCIVGYNDPEGYWIVKNSWGSDWGEDGFARIAYGQSGIETFAFLSVEAARI